MSDDVHDKLVYDKLEQIYKVLSSQRLEHLAYEATEIAQDLGDDDLFLRAEIVRLALDIADSVTNYQHTAVQSTAERLLDSVQKFYSPG